MRPWTFPVALDPNRAEPLYLQLARAIADDIQRGRLPPGAVLPGSRALARTLGLHRNTVLAGLRELQAEGWVETSANACRVVEHPPFPVQASLPGPPSAPPGFAFSEQLPALSPVSERPGLDSYGGGLPDVRLLPADAIARAYGRALKARRFSPLGYGDSRGDPQLRRALAGMLSEVRGLPLSDEGLMVTGGSQMGLFLIASALLRPGDTVVVEDPGYPPAWSIFRGAGAQLLPLPVDEEGLRVDLLSELLTRQRVRAVYLTPHHQFPTMATLPPGRRRQLLALAREHQLAIIEDDYDFEFHYEGRPVLPMASTDTAGVVLYLGTLSKLLTPALRMGFVVAPPAFTEVLVRQRKMLDLQGNQAMERAVSELLEDGLVQRHARKMRRIYQARRVALAEALERHLGHVLRVPVPSGGMSLWLPTQPGLDVDAWASHAQGAGVSVAPGSTFDFHGHPLPALRMGFTAKNEQELEAGVRKLAASLEGRGRR